MLYIMYMYTRNRRYAVEIIITNAGGQPIYDQISSQIKEKIISGELKEGDALPSMRVLAKELRISVITTKRAYEELERDGFIVSLTGKGSFVAGKNTEFIKEEHLRRIEELMRQVITLSTGCGLSLEDLRQMLTLLYQED